MDDFDAYWETQSQKCPACGALCEAKAHKLLAREGSVTREFTYVGWKCGCGWSKMTDEAKKMLRSALEIFKAEQSEVW